MSCDPLTNPSTKSAIFLVGFKASCAKYLNSGIWVPLSANTLEFCWARPWPQVARDTHELASLEKGRLSPSLSFQRQTALEFVYSLVFNFFNFAGSAAHEWKYLDVVWVHQRPQVAKNSLPLERGQLPSYSSSTRSTRIRVFDCMHSYPPFNSSWHNIPRVVGMMRAWNIGSTKLK